MIYKEEYLEKYFDGFDFFDPENRDRRIREVWLRTKRCLDDPSFADFQMHPTNWATGMDERRAMNNSL